MTLTVAERIDASRDPRRQPQIKPSDAVVQNIAQQQALVNRAASVSVQREAGGSSKNSSVEKAASVQTVPRRHSYGLSMQTKENHSLVPKDLAKSTRIAKNEAGLPVRKRDRAIATSLQQPRAPAPSRPSFGYPGISMSPGRQGSAADIVALMSQVPVKRYTSPTNQSMSQVACPSNTIIGSAQPIKSHTHIPFGPRIEERAAPRPRPLESDTSERMARDVETELEYVKGQGPVLIRHASATTTNNAQMTKPVIPDDETFPVNYCWNNTRFITLKYVKWIASIDGFELDIGRGKKMLIHAEAVSTILYNLRCRKFCLLPNKDIGPEKRLQELVLEVGGDEKTPFKLRSLFERRFGAIKVSPVEEVYFVYQERSFEEANLYTVPPRSATQLKTMYHNSSDDLSDGVLEDLNLLNAWNGDRQQAMKASGLQENTNILELSSPEVEYDTSTSPVSINASPAAASTLTLHRRDMGCAESSMAQQDGKDLGHSPGPKKISLAMYKQRRQVPKMPARGTSASLGNVSSEEQKKEFRVNVKEVAVLRPNVTGRSILPGFIAGNDPENSTNSAEADSIASETRIPDSSGADFVELHYISGQPVRINDLVIRIRDMEDINGGNDKFDKLDIFDGPFRINELPRPLSPLDDPEGLAIGGQPSNDEDKHDKIKAMQEKLIKLHFPQETKAEPWTKLGRLRPVFSVPAEVSDELDARTTYYWGKDKGIKRPIMNTENMRIEEDDVSDTRGVCHIQKRAYVRVNYVTADSSESGDEYEVEKLRGKIIKIHPREKFPEERMDDPAIVDYFAQGNTISGKEVLVVKYRIHWAGWPSEDDSYERAHDNIPQAFIDAYNESVGRENQGQDIVVQSSRVEPVHKWHKSDVKRFFSS